MRRRFMMWMTIICILVVGVSVTKMTREFVMSQGVDAVAILSVQDAGIRDLAPAALAGGALVDQKAAPMEVERAYAEHAAVTEETAPASEAAAEEPEAALEAVPEIAAEEYADGKNSSSDMLSEPVLGAPKAPIDTTKQEAIQETVKSPLDPVVVQEYVLDTQPETVSNHAEDFFERFAQAEKNAVVLWENISAENRTAYLAAAEQEYNLWDYELNHVYQIIRSKLSQEENEELKILEVEWLRERDLYAEKASAKSGMKNAQNQNPDYIRALTEKTKERCYWLVSEYEEILNQDE